LTYLRDAVEAPEFFDYAQLAAEEPFVPLHDAPEFRRLFLVN
jgi:hypothetical protein